MPAACRSKPSISATMKQRAMVCSGLVGDAAIRANMGTSIVLVAWIWPSAVICTVRARQAVRCPLEPHRLPCGHRPRRLWKYRAQPQQRAAWRWSPEGGRSAAGNLLEPVPEHAQRQQRGTQPLAAGEAHVRHAGEQVEAVAV